MRRRRYQRGPWVLVVAFLSSALLHIVGGLQLQANLPWLLSSSTKKQAAPPVRVVQLSPDVFERSLKQARRAARAKAVETRVQKKKEERRKRDRPKGQIVEVPSQNRVRPKNARFLALEDSSVEKETRARERDESKSRVTNKIQERRSGGGRKATGTPSPNVTPQDGGAKRNRAGKKGKGRRRERRRRFELTTPKLERRSNVKLDLNLPELGLNRVRDRRSDNSSPRPSRGRDNEHSDPSGQRRGRDSGGADGLPSLEQLRPTLGTIARISGSPSDDYIENVPDGEGNFLNTRSFKYATFFYQVRNSVAQFWKSDVRAEIRRRDPTGDIYGPGNLKTLLFVRLDDTGRLSEVRVAESSGYQFLDAVAVRAFKQAESFPNPPKGIVDDDGHINFHFAFVLYTGRRGPLNLFR